MGVKPTNPFYTNQCKNLSDYIFIDVTSRSARNKEFMKAHPTFAKDLSPFFIGPLVSSDGVECKRFEIFWQCGKVYPPHDDNGKPNSKYFEWRNYYYSLDTDDRKILRHTNETLGCSHSDTRYFAYYNKETGEWEALDYVTARKKVYFPEYAKLVVNTESYKWLKSLVDSGKKIALVDFDAYNFYSPLAMEGRYKSYLNKCKKYGKTPSLTISDFLNVKSMKDLANCRFLAGGHACVLKAMLEGDIEVVDGKVIDHAGILE